MRSIRRVRSGGWLGSGVSFIGVRPPVRSCHGSLYAGWNRGRIDIEALRTVVAGLVVPAAADGRIVLAVDMRCRLRPEAFLLADLPPVRRRCDRVLRRQPPP